MMNEKTSFLSKEELAELQFKSIGEEVYISRKASIYNVREISIGSNVRIDDFCILSGNINLGNNIHISAYTGLFAGDVGIQLEDYTTVSSRCGIYAISDDYSGEALANATIPEKYRKVYKGKVTLNKYALVGSGTTILPGVIIGEGTSVGCMSLVKESLPSWEMYAGIPVRKIGERSKQLLRFVDEYEGKR